MIVGVARERTVAAKLAAVAAPKAVSVPVTRSTVVKFALAVLLMVSVLPADASELPNTASRKLQCSFRRCTQLVAAHVALRGSPSSVAKSARPASRYQDSPLKALALSNNSAAPTAARSCG